EANREDVTRSVFMDWARQEGMSTEDATQAWDMYAGIWDKNSGQIATQGDFDRIQRDSINDQALQYLDAGAWNRIFGSSGVLTLDPRSIDDPVTLAAYNGALALDKWMSTRDLATILSGKNTQESITFKHMLLGAGASNAAVDAMMAKGYDAASSGDLVSYYSPEAKASRQAYSMVDVVDKHWEEIYYGSMTIPVNSQYVSVNEQTGGYFPTAGPSTWYSGTGAWNFDDTSDWEHKGVDIGGLKGTPVLSALSGTISASGYSNVSGNYVIVQHANGQTTKYMHLAYPSPTAVGDKVSAGTSIGQIGNTGNASGGGYHLHFQYHVNGQAVDPKLLIPWSRTNVHDPPSNAYASYTPQPYDTRNLFT
ncbi:MAG: M23 family metallopeptidase, partial [Actinomycetia bacterium]|nr:M23 family metallopeptidase [Actinomycetes bacterium]